MYKPPFLRWFVCGLTWGVLALLHLATVVPSHAFVILSSYAAFSRQYEVGTIYSYTYKTSVLLNEPLANPVSTPKDIGFKVDLIVNILPLWQNPSNANEQIMEMKVSVPKLSVKARQGPTPTGFVQKPSKADSLSQLPFYLHREGGLVKKVYYDNREHLSFVNLKKGIASLLQYQVKGSTVTEVDASGRCDVSYTLKDKNQLLKSKENCLPAEPLHGFNHTNKVFDAVILSHSETSLELDPEDTSIKTATSVETHVLRPEARKSSGLEIISSQSLVLKERSQSSSNKFSGSLASGVIQSISKAIRTSLVAEVLSTLPEPKECIACKTLTDLINSFRKSLSSNNLASQSSAISFLRLLRKVRDSDIETIKEVLVDKKNIKILPQILDIVAASQTIPAHVAAMTVLKFDGANINLAERYLLGLSLNTHPLEFVIEDLLKWLKRGLKSEKLSETLILTIASMTNTFSGAYRNKNQSIISTVRHAFVTELSACDMESCQLLYIRALKNLQCKSTVPILINIAKSGSKKAAIYAMRAIQTMPTEFIDTMVTKELEKILFELDAPHDSSVKAMAAEVLLRTLPDEEVIKSVFHIMRNQTEKELNTLLLGHISDLCEKNPMMNEIVGNVLNKHNLKNYHVLSQGGLSTAFSRPLTEGSSVNASFINMLEMKGGILKRSNVDVFVDVGEHRTRLLSFGMFAGGLSMFAGDDASGGDDEDAHAGIEISLLNTQLRPYLFFSGQGELMGHVWSGTASDRTTVLQGSVLLQDHLQVVPLQNGLNVELLLTGVVSYDFAGQVQISLWNRNAHSLVEIGAAVVIQGQARVDNSFVQTMIEFNVGSQSQLNFISDLDFSDDIMMCSQMEQPQFDIIDNVRKLESIPGSNYILRKYKRKSSAVPGKSYVINRKNTELCNKMHNK